MLIQINPQFNARSLPKPDMTSSIANSIVINYSADSVTFSAQSVKAPSRVRRFFDYFTPRRILTGATMLTSVGSGLYFLPTIDTRVIVGGSALLSVSISELSKWIDNRRNRRTSIK